MNRQILTQNPACNPACRACHYKALDYDEQIRRKQGWASEQLGRWDQALKLIRPAPESERLAYRSKSWLRSSFDGGKLSFGIYRAIKVQGSWEQEFISWDTCPLHVRAIHEMTERLREILPHHAPRFSAEALFGAWFGNPHLVLVARDLALDELDGIDWSQILKPPFDRVWLHKTQQVGRRVFQHRHFHQLAGPERNDDYPILAFRQVAQALLSEARQLALAALLASKPSLVIDLYCGTGELSQLLPADVGWLGIELTPQGAAYAERLRDPKKVLHEAFVGTVEQRLLDPRFFNKIKVPYSLYLNPPRSGLSPEARDRMQSLLQAKPPSTVVYLSCSASSLGRDLELFERQGYKVILLQPYDFFPHTEHFETLAVLEAGK